MNNQASRNLACDPSLGQVWTPTEIAILMAETVLNSVSGHIHVLDPACGPGTFSSAFASIIDSSQIQIDAIDIDQRWVAFTQEIHEKHGLVGHIIQDDFLTRDNISIYDVVIMNPPYIRQELIDPLTKERVHREFTESTGILVDKRANMYALFLMKAAIALPDGGLLAAIVYDSFNHTKYGKTLFQFFQSTWTEVMNLGVTAPFDSVMVDAQIIIFKKLKGTPEQKTISIGEQAEKYVKLRDLVEVKRGIELSPRASVIHPISSKPDDKYEPVIVKPGSLSTFEAKPTHQVLRAYLSGKKAKSANILFSYFFRNRIRHFWNPQQIIASDNFYLLKIKSSFPAEVAWLLLNSTVYTSILGNHARSQGSGLKKLQVYEYLEVAVPDWRRISSNSQEVLRGIAKTQFGKAEISDEANDQISKLVGDVFQNET